MCVYVCVRVCRERLIVCVCGELRNGGRQEDKGPVGSEQHGWGLAARRTRRWTPLRLRRPVEMKKGSEPRPWGGVEALQPSPCRGPRQWGEIPLLFHPEMRLDQEEARKDTDRERNKEK